MKKASSVIAFLGSTLVIGLVWISYGLFHGLFDHGNFEIQQTQISPSGQIAVVGRRSDLEALSGDQYFVIVSDRQLSSADLKDAYYHNGVVFRSGSDCLTVRWESVHNLIIKCKDHSIATDQIAVQQSRVGEVYVVYDGIPAASAK